MEMAPSSSGLGRRPLKAEVEGSNPFGATMNFQTALRGGFCFRCDFPCWLAFAVPGCSRFGWGSSLGCGVFFAFAAFGAPVCCCRQAPLQRGYLAVGLAQLRQESFCIPEMPNLFGIVFYLFVYHGFKCRLKCNAKFGPRRISRRNKILSTHR